VTLTLYSSDWTHAAGAAGPRTGERARGGGDLNEDGGTSPKTLLIVDEHARLRCAIADIVSEAGYAVLEAASGAEGLRVAERHAPDGVLVDLAMPGRSGLEVLTELKQRDPTRPRCAAARAD
jgi:CheY-like chemotaxis protein